MRPIARPGALVRSTALTLCLSLFVACGELPPDDPASTALRAEEWLEGSTVVELVSESDGVVTRSPVILTPDASHAWSSAFRLVCRSNCEGALRAFGYRTKPFLREYRSIEALRHGERLDDTIPIVDLALEGGAASSAVLAAYRVVDAEGPSDPRYLLRLRESPETLYEPLCADFLRATRGSLATVPISKGVLVHWGALTRAGADGKLVPVKPFPRIGCSSLEGELLPPPPPAERVTSLPPALSLAEVWTVTRPEPTIRSSSYPYLVTRDERGVMRGFAVDCGSEAYAALAALGVAPRDVRTTPASSAELEATGFGKQPVLRCAGAGGSAFVAFRSENDTSRLARIKFEGERDLVELACSDSSAYWQARAASTLEVPYQALRHLSDSQEGIGETRIHRIGCRGVMPTAPSECGFLRAGEGLQKGQRHTSCNGRYHVLLQEDGDAVLYRRGGRAFWSSKTSGSAAETLIMQADGNLVLYDAQRRPLWSSGTSRYAGAHARVQDDGNFVVYEPGGTAVWASHTMQPPIEPALECGVAHAGQGLVVGDDLWSCDRRFVLRMQSDGNLVLYKGSAALWDTGTHGKGGRYAVMQADGNFVLYDGANKPLWASGTHRHPGALLAVQNDGNLVVYAPPSVPVWASGTHGH